MMNKKGFTLVELSIVLVIIGLLIGGILAAQSMIGTARHTKLIQTFQQYEIAVRNFHEIYKYYPGDLPDLGARFNSTEPTFANGGAQGDGYVGTGNYGSWEPFFSFADMQTVQIINQGFKYPQLAWEASNTGADPSTVSLWPLPKLPDHGLLSLQSGGAHLGPYDSYSSTFSQCHVALLAGTLGPGTTTFFKLDIATGNYTPVDAEAIDTKIDDGKPSTGHVLGDQGSAFDGHRGCISTGDYNSITDGPFDGSIKYNISNTNKSCIVNSCIDETLFSN